MTSISRTPSPGPVNSFASSSRVSNTKSQSGGKKKAKAKSSDRTEAETRKLLTVWGPYYSRLRSASNKDSAKIWNAIYTAYKERCPNSEIVLTQVKKRQKNLEYDYKHLKQRAQSTGEAGLKRTKEGFPYFDFFDDVMGHRDSVDPSKMAIEGSSMFSSEESSPSLSSQGNVDDTENTEGDEETATPNEGGQGVKRKATDKLAKSSRKGKKKRDEQTETAEWQTSFRQLMERSMELENLRFKRSTAMFQESQRMQMDQTNAILAGFKDIFKDLASK